MTRVRFEAHFLPRFLESRRCRVRTVNHDEIAGFSVDRIARITKHRRARCFFLPPSPPSAPILLGAARLERVHPENPARGSNGAFNPPFSRGVLPGGSV